MRSVARKSSIDQLPEPVRVAVDEALAQNRLTLDQILDRLQAEFGDAALPSRSALGRRKQRLDKILAKHRATNEVMQVLIKEFGTGQGQMSRGIIEMIRMAVHDVAEQLSADEAPDVKALSALSLAAKRLADAEEATVKTEARIREQLASEVDEAVEKAPRRFDAETLAFVRKALRGEE